MCLSNGLYCVTTDKTARSPNISTVGFSGITLQFNYIHLGTALLDNAQVVYSINGGTTWTLLTNLPKSICCSGGASCATGCTNNAGCTGSHQGKWTLFSSALPIACENIANLQVGIRWYNDDVSTAGKDPSVAIDDLIIYTGTLPIEYSYLQTSSSINGVNLFWQTYTEVNNKGFDIERSTNGINFEKVLEVGAKGPSFYEVVDESANLNTLYYYRFKQNDFNGKYTYSNITTALINDYDVLNVFPNPANNKINFNIKNELNYKIEIFNALGEKVYSNSQNSNSQCIVNTTSFANGIYFYKFIIGSNVFFNKIIIQH